MTEKPVVVFGLPTYKHISPTAHLSVVSLVAFSVANGYASGYLSSDMALVDIARNNIVLSARADTAKPTHIMWVDDDIIVPKTTLRSLLSHDEGVVGGLYFKRTPPYEPAAYSSLAPFMTFEPPDAGVHRIEGLGLGCTLVAMEVYDEMEAYFGDQRWHLASYGSMDDGTPTYVGEDIWFFRRCKEIGVPVWIDGSIRAGHVTDSVVASRRGFE